MDQLIRSMVSCSALCDKISFLLTRRTSNRSVNDQIAHTNVVRRDFFRNNHAVFRDPYVRLILLQSHRLRHTTLGNWQQMGSANGL